MKELLQNIRKLEDVIDKLKALLCKSSPEFICKCKDVPLHKHHAMKTYRGMMVKLHAFLT
jgi:hypothetical protein